MAIVADKSDAGMGIVDKPFDTHNRTNAGEPNGSITPQYSGEIILDTTGNCYWKAMGVANNTWVATTAPN